MTPSHSRTSPLPPKNLLIAYISKSRTGFFTTSGKQDIRFFEQELAAELGVSRTPVREALIRLQRDGLVKVIPRHGMRVQPISAVDVQEIYEILTSLGSACR